MDFGGIYETAENEGFSEDEQRTLYSQYIGSELGKLLQTERANGYRIRKEKKKRLFSIPSIEHKIYKIMTEPRSSILALSINVFIILVIIWSIVLFFVQSWPTFWDKDSLRTTWFLQETFIISVFTLEFIVRMITCPDKMAFFLSPFALIDIFSVVPYFVYCFLVLLQESPWDPTWIAILKSIRLLVLIRILKLGKYTTFFEAAWEALWKTRDAFVLMVFNFILLMFFFSSFLYFAEQIHEEFDYATEAWYYTIENPWTDSKGPFQSIPETFWWWIVTASTEGYGDTYPITGLGKFVAGMTVLTGIMAFGFPLAVFGIKFAEELNAVNSRRRVKLYAYEHDEMIAKEKLKKMYKKIQAFNSSIISIKETCDQLSESLHEILLHIERDMASLET